MNLKISAGLLVAFFVFFSGVPFKLGKGNWDRQMYSGKVSFIQDGIIEFVTNNNKLVTLKFNEQTKLPKSSESLVGKKVMIFGSKDVRNGEIQASLVKLLK